MIGYVTLGSNDVPKAAKFYDELLAVIGADRIFEGDNFVAWGTGARQDGFSAGYFRDLDGNKLNVFCMVANDS